MIDAFSTPFFSIFRDKYFIISGVNKYLFEGTVSNKYLGYPVGSKILYYHVKHNNEVNLFMYNRKTNI